MNHQLGLNEIRVTKLLLHETGTYNRQYRRPYETQLDGSVLGILEERLSSSSRFMPAQLAGVAGQFIRPSATTEKLVEIPNGWNERRMRFMMEVEYRYPSGALLIENVLGYTNYVGVTGSGTIDPQMDFVINSVVHVRRTEEHTPLGNQVYSTVIDNSQILSDQSYQNVAQGAKDQRMRPQDVYAAMSRNHLQMEKGTVFDGRTVVSAAPEKSRRSNNVPAAYMAGILDKYQQAVTVQDVSSVSVEQELYHQARGFSAEKPTGADPFIKSMASVRGMPIGATFTYRDLMRLDPNVDHVAVCMLQGQTMRAGAIPVHQQGQTEEWGGADIHTVSASILSNSVPGLLMDFAITGVAFTASNQNFGLGQMNRPVMITISNAEGFSSADLYSQLEQFKIELEHTILNDLSYNNAISYWIEMRVDLLGETRIEIALDGGPKIPYVTPSFSDALLTPVVTNNDSRVLDVSRSFEALFGTLQINPAANIGGLPPQYNPQIGNF